MSFDGKSTEGRSFERSIRYASFYDGAIDWDADAPDDETQTARDARVKRAVLAYIAKPDHTTLRLKPGAQLTIFELAPLSRQARTLVEQYPDERHKERNQEAVAYGLRSVKNCTLPSGEPVELERDKSGRLTKATMDALYEAGISTDVFDELAARIISDSRLGFTSR
jgi:hypothetical protein